MDDGSESMAMSVEMLKLAKSEGVTELFVTPHGDFICEEIDNYHTTFEQFKEEAVK